MNAVTSEILHSVMTVIKAYIHQVIEAALFQHGKHAALSLPEYQVHSLSSPLQNETDDQLWFISSAKCAPNCMGTCPLTSNTCHTLLDNLGAEMQSDKVKLINQNHLHSNTGMNTCYMVMSSINDQW